MVTGSHLLKKHGFTINEIIKSKLKIYDKFQMFDENYIQKDTGSGMAIALGKAVMKLAPILEKSKFIYYFIWF